MRPLILLLAVFVTTYAEGQNVLYFADSSKPGKHVPLSDQLVATNTGSPINLKLEIKTASVKERGELVNLVVDDYRYDTPNYFTDHRVPNVRFEVKNSEGKPVPFRVSSQGGGAQLQYLDAHVAIEIGGDPKQIDEENTRIYQQVLDKALTPEEAGSRMLAVKQKYVPNQPGTYQVRAIYHPNVPGKWDGELVTATITIVVPVTK